MNIQQPAPGVKVKTWARDRFADDANADVAETGAGFKPKAVLVFGFINGTKDGSWGYSDGPTSICMWLDPNNADKFGAGFSGVAKLYTAANAGQTATVKQFDADGVTLTWTKVGAPAHTTVTAYLIAWG